MGLLNTVRQPFRTKMAARPEEPTLGYYVPPENGARPVAIKTGSAISYNAAGGFTEGLIQPTPAGYAYAYTISTWAYRCVQIRRKAVGRMPWKVIDKRTSQVLPNHPLAVALRRNKQKLFGKIEFSQVLFGETFIEKVRNPAKYPADLKWMNNLGVDVDTSLGEISAYHYSPIQGGPYKTLKPTDVAFLYTENPFDDLRGLSPFLVILDELGIDRDVARVTRAFFANDARPGLLLVPEKEMQEADRLRFMDFWKKNFQGSKNAGKPALLSHKVEVKEIQRPPSLDDVSLRESTRREICAALGVPLSIAGAWDDAQYQSSPEQRKSLYEETIIPECDDIQDFFNSDVLPFFDDSGTAEFQFDYSSILALIEDTNDKVTKLNNKLLSGGITLNRYREQIGEKPLGSTGEVFYVPSGVTVTPLAKLGQMPAPQPSPFGGLPPGGLFQNNPPLVQDPPTAHALVPAAEPPKALLPKAVPQKAAVAPAAEPLPTVDPALKVIDIHAQETADAELAAWEKKALNGGAQKALGFTCYKLPEPVQMQIKTDLAALDKDAPRGAVKAVFAAAKLEMASIADKEFDPNQPRDDSGQWSETGGGGASHGSDKPTSSKPLGAESRPPERPITMLDVAHAPPAEREALLRQYNQQHVERMHIEQEQERTRKLELSELRKRDPLAATITYLGVQSGERGPVLPRDFERATGQKLEDVLSASGVRTLGSDPEFKYARLTVNVQKQSSDMSIRIDADDSTTDSVNMTRVLHYKNGKPDVIENHQFFLGDKHQGTGIGTKVFKSEVDAAAKAGFKRINTLAGKGPKMNGYYTWPRLGYDAEVSYYDKQLPEGVLSKIKPNSVVDTPIGKAINFNVSELMKMPEGRDWWKTNGKEMEMSFDLSSKSRGKKVLNAYYRERFGSQ